MIFVIVIVSITLCAIAFLSGMIIAKKINDDKKIEALLQTLKTDTTNIVGKVKTDVDTVVDDIKKI